MRVISGVLMIKSDSVKKGRATIGFHPFEVSGDATLGDKAVVNGEGHYAANPCASVSLRRVRLYDSTTGSGHNTEFNIDDSISKDKLVVSWNAPAAKIHEISFLVIGKPA